MLLAAPAVAAGAAPYTPYRDAVMADVPTNYYRFDEPYPSSTMEAEDGAGPDGHHVSEPFLASPGALKEEPNGSVFYSSSDDDRSYFAVNDISHASGVYDDFSLEFWVWTNQTDMPHYGDQWYNGYGLVDGEISGVQDDAGTALMSDGTVGFGLGNPDTTIRSTTAINDSEWHHVVATSDGSGGSGRMRLYVDGQLEADRLNGPTAQRDNTFFTLGMLNTQVGPVTATLDEVAFYNYALPGGRVAEHYSAATNPPPPPEPPNKLRVYPIGAGRGDISAPGILCYDTGGAAAGDCYEEYPHGTQVTVTPHPHGNSRFGGFDNPFGGIGGYPPTCDGGSACSFTARAGGDDTVAAIFHLKPKPLAKAVDDAKSARKTIDKKLGSYVTPHTGNYPTDFFTIDDRCECDLGQARAKLAVLAPPNLIGSDGATLVGKVKLAEFPSAGRLISDKGAGLIGSDGATLVSKTKLIQIGSNRAQRAQVRPGRNLAGPELELYVIGGYSVSVDGQGEISVQFDITEEGKGVLKAWRRANIRRLNDKDPKTNALVMPATWIEVVLPRDGVASGGVIEKISIK